jgi:hypothetical protein
MVLEPVQKALVIYTHVHRECDIVKLSGAFSWLDSGGSEGAQYSVAATHAHLRGIEGGR